MIDFPREPNPGESLDASWGARVVRALRALFPMPGPGIKTSTGPSGTTISSIAPHGSESGGSGDAIPCRVSPANENDWADGVDVTLFADGFMASSTGSGRLYLPEVGSRTKPQPNMAVLAHRLSVVAIDGGTDEDPEEEES